MDAKQLKYLVAVYECRGFRAASDRVHVTQPAISASIAKLEDELSVRLIDRSFDDIRLTPEGEVLYRHAKSILTQFENARSDIDAFAGLSAGRIRIGAPVMIGTYVVPKWVWAFSKRYPTISFELYEMGAGELENALSEGEVDLGFTGSAVVGDEFRAKQLRSATIFAGVGKTHPFAKRKSLSWSDIFSSRLALFEGSYYIRRYLDERARKAGKHLDVAFQAGTPELLMRACENSPVVTLLMEEAFENQKRIVKIAVPGFPKLAVSAVWRKETALSVASAAFLDSVGAFDR